MALDRQAPALDRVREQDRGPIGDRVAFRQAREHRAEVVATEVPDRGAHLRVAELGDQARDCPPPGARAGQPLAQLARVAAQQPLVLLVRHLVDPPPQIAAAVAPEQLAQPRAVLDRHRLPAGGLEHRQQAADRHVRHDAVERLPVEVDDPEHLSELCDDRVADRLPDGSLVQLGVAEQGDLAAAAWNVEVPRDVAVGERAPDHLGRPDADRARGVVDRVGVLGPRRIALQPAEVAQPLEERAVELAEQVVDRVQDGGRVRFDRDAVGRPQVREPERGHQRHHRGARRLVSADLDSGRALPHPVRVVDDRGREPEHASLDRLQGSEVGGRGALALRAFDGLADHPPHDRAPAAGMLPRSFRAACRA